MLVIQALQRLNHWNQFKTGISYQRLKLARVMGESISEKKKKSTEKQKTPKQKETGMYIQTYSITSHTHTHIIIHVPLVMHMKSHAFCSSIQIKTQPLRNTQLHVHYVHSNSSLNLLDPPCHFFTQACPVSMPTSLYSTHIQILQSLVSTDRPQLGYNQILLILLFSYLSPQYCGI